MTTTAALDIRDLFTGTGAFGPAEIASLTALLGAEPPAHRDLRAAVKELEGHGERSPASSVRLGVGQYLLGRWNDALQTLRSADGGALAHYYQARSLLALARAGGQAADALEKAEEAFAAAQKGGYDAVACGVGAAEALRLAGKVKEAEKALAKVGPSAESSADFWAEKASLAADLGLPMADTVGALEKALSLDPGHPAALFAMGVINDRCGNDDEAKQCYERAVQQYPASLGALVNLGILYEDRDDFAGAQQCYKRILQIFPDHPRARLFLTKGLSLGQFAASAVTEEVPYEPEVASEDEQEIFSLPITELALSVRARKCTTKLGITTIGELIRRTAEDLMECKNFGVTSLNEVREKLTERGLKLRGD